MIFPFALSSVVSCRIILCLEIIFGSRGALNVPDSSVKRPNNKKIKVQSAFVEMNSMFLMLRGISGKACTLCSSPSTGG